MHAQAAVLAGAGQTNEYAELGRRPLRRRRVAIAADVVAGFFLKGSELLRKEKKDVSRAPGRETTVRTLDRVSGSTSHMALDAIAGGITAPIAR